MNTLRTVAPVILLATALGASIYVEAADSSPGEAGTAAMTPGHHGFGHRADALRHVLHKLDLSADQKASIKSIYQQEKPQLQALAASSRATRQTLLSAAPGSPEYAAALAAAKTNADSRVQLASDIYAQVYAVLTPAQQAQIPTLVAEVRNAVTAGRQTHTW